MSKNTFFRICALAAAIVLPLSLLSGCARKARSFDTFAMGSAMNVKLYTSEEIASKYFPFINDAVTACDNALSVTKEDAELTKLNEKGYSKLSFLAFNTVCTAAEICAMCPGTDVTIGAVSSLWNFSGDTPCVPPEKELAKALKTVGLPGVELNKEERTVRLSSGQRLDLGAFGKGAALDEAMAVLYGKDFSALMTFGGSVALKGNAPGKKAWTVGVRDPFGTANDVFATLTLTPENEDGLLFVSTSGSYEKSFEENGKTYHHLLSPETGMPVENGLAAVTVVSPAGVTADALSTACFVQGLNEETLSCLGLFGAEAVFVFTDGSYYVTEGLRDSFTLTAETGFTEHLYEE